MSQLRRGGSRSKVMEISEAPVRIFHIFSVNSPCDFPLKEMKLLSCDPDSSGPLWDGTVLIDLTYPGWSVIHRIKRGPDKYPVCNPNPLLKIRNSALTIWGFWGIHSQGEEFTWFYSGWEQKSNGCWWSQTAVSLMIAFVGSVLRDVKCRRKLIKPREEQPEEECYKSVQALEGNRTVIYIFLELLLPKNIISDVSSHWPQIRWASILRRADPEKEKEVCRLYKPLIHVLTCRHEWQDHLPPLHQYNHSINPSLPVKPVYLPPLHQYSQLSPPFFQYNQSIDHLHEESIGKQSGA